ncbi:hypothetical protein KIW84_041666 [Lathyrus oleraceus]|uniref:Uncharacterized protein n=1 Tax=Pisum sativum TaxID=3888 RepID=A0A9D4XAI2_PEA|nr:hypothetical protein KIW84_041666 [Pisum sativum]
MSILDRFLISENLILSWNIVGQIVGTRDISDHYPIWLKASSENWGPKPFKFNNCWLNHKYFARLIEEEWLSFKVLERGDFFLKEKLRMLKLSLKKWNVEVFRWIDLKVEEAVKELNVLDFRASNSEVLPLGYLEAKRDLASSVVSNHLNLNESFLRQKSRAIWLKEGDRNYNFFHREMREEFSSIPVLSDVEMEYLSIFDSKLLEIAFTDEEVKIAVWIFNGSKSLGPDNFSFIFLQNCWESVKTDIVSFVLEFYSNPSLTKAATTSFITLVLKISNPQNLEAFPNLFHLFPNQKSSVEDSGCWCGVVWNWSVSIPSLLPSLELSRDLVGLETFLAEKAPVIGLLDNFE